MSAEGKQRLKAIAQTNNIESLSINDNLIASLIDEEIVNYLTFNIISDYQIEIFLTSFRKSLLNLIFEQEFEQLNILNLQLFLSILSKQCFNTEYVFFVSEQEKFYLDIFSQQTIEFPESIVWLRVLIIACYKNIQSEKQIVKLINSKNTFPIEIENLIKYQITDTRTEDELKNTIKKTSRLTHDITKNVKQHYERNPYPRWFKISDVTEQSIDVFIEQSLFDNMQYTLKNIPETVLVIGCGTGLLSIEHASRFSNSKIISIDLSLSSLAYAKRKAMELQFNNIEFIQMDLMDIDQLNIQFDFIDCMGVLSHIAKPQKALEMFINQLSVQGILRFNLYSELARRTIRKSVNYIQEKQYSESDEVIRSLRHDLIKIDGFEKLIELKDYYYMSGVRDMLFHRYENHYDLIEIKNMLGQLNSQLLGLELTDKTIYQEFSKQYQTQSLFENLNRWHDFEQQYPDTFKNDYVVWLQKNR